MRVKLILCCIAIFGAGLYCSEFLLPKKKSKKTVTNEQLIHRLELLMRTWSRLLTKLGALQEYGINTIVALLEHDKLHPLVVQKANRQPFVDRVSTLTNHFSQLDHELESFCTFLKQMKEETRNSIIHNA